MGLETNWMLMVMGLMVVYAAVIVVGLFVRAGRKKS